MSLSFAQQRERARCLEVMARAAFDAEWDQPGNPQPENCREGNWRLYRERYLLMMRAVLPAMFKAGFGIAAVPRNSTLVLPSKEDIELSREPF